MLVVKGLKVVNFRSHKDKSIELSKNVTIIIGKNGSGKTSLLEAIHIALQGTSFKGSDQDILQNNKPWWRIEVLMADNSRRQITFDPQKTDRKKAFTIDNKINYRIPQKSKIPVVLFEPDDLGLINGSPSRRRRFLDRLISQAYPTYSTTLRKYERALIQRNNLLKKNPSNDDLFVWDVAISEYGSEIIRQRKNMCDTINNRLAEVYESISKKADKVSISYPVSLTESTSHKILRELNDSIERDKYTGSTTIGPHRHDIVFDFNNSPASSSASRGEIRTIILAVKFIEVDTIKNITGVEPIILLDDVFSELDESRQEALITYSNKNQIIITSAQKADYLNKFEHINID